MSPTPEKFDQEQHDDCQSGDVLVTKGDGEATMFEVDGGDAWLQVPDDILEHVTVWQ